MNTLQQCASNHAGFQGRFNQERHLAGREIFKQRRSAALAERREVAA
jgi:putative transposase